MSTKRRVVTVRTPKANEVVVVENGTEVIVIAPIAATEIATEIVKGAAVIRIDHANGMVRTAQA